MRDSINVVTRAGIFQNGMKIAEDGLRYFRFEMIEIRLWQGSERTFLPLVGELQQHDWDDESAQLKLVLDIPASKPMLTISGHKIIPGSTLEVVLKGTAPHTYTLESIRTIL